MSVPRANQVKSLPSYARTQNERPHSHPQRGIRSVAPARGTRRNGRLRETRLEPRLLQKIAETLLLAGVSSTELKKAVSRATALASRRMPRLPRKRAQFDWWMYARVLSAWHRSPEFTDENGLGKSLPLTGRRSFQSLVATALPGTKPQLVLDALKALGAVRIASNCTVRPTSRSLIVEQRTQMTLLRAIQLCDALLSTIRSNWQWSSTDKLGLFERSVVAERFDMRHLPAFDGLVRAQGQALLELLDSWLANHETTGRENRRRREGRVGVEIFVFADRKSQSGSPV